MALSTGCLATVPGVASASALHSWSLSGTQSAVACLEPQLCVVVGGNGHGEADIIDVGANKPAPAIALKEAKYLLGISCPAPAGCMAMGQPVNGRGLYLVQLGANGQPVVTAKGGPLAQVTVKTPSGVSFSAFSCHSVFNCKLFGTMGTRSSLALGLWDGLALRTETVGLPSGLKAYGPEAISCYIGCVAVAAVSGRTSLESVIYPVSGMTVGHVATVRGVALRSISCFSATTCYAVGQSATGASLVTIENGRPTAAYNLPGQQLNTIACGATSCAAGGALAKSGRKSGDLVPIIGAGHPGRAELLAGTTAISALGAPSAGAGFAALGSVAGAGQEISFNR